MRILWAALLTASLLASGCLSNSDKTDGNIPVSPDAGYLYQGPGTLFAGEPLYADPQNTPHPAFNWPTLSHPASGGQVPALWKAIQPAQLPATLDTLELVKQTPGVASGAGIAIFGSIVVVPGYGAPTAVVDITDPANPTVLSTFEPQEGLSNHRGAAFIAYPTGKLVVVISTGSGIDVWDLTDPTLPAPLPPLVEDKDGNPVRSHKVGVIPGTPIVVNAASGGGAAGAPEDSTSITKMWDLSDPFNPQILPDFQNGYSCHHVYFWNNIEENKTRAVCAGIQYTQIWDTSDPYNPSVIVSVPFGSGGTPADAGDRSIVFPASLSHYAGLSVDGKVLLMGDEWGGGGGPVPPGCVARVDVPGLGAVSVPLGAVWFYDVSVETEPALLGWYSASTQDKLAGNGDPTRSCTAHHGRLVPVPGRDVLAMSYYAAGVIVVDFTNLRTEGASVPQTVAQFADGSDTWETWYYQGYLFTGDLARGMDVLQFT